MWWNKQKEQNMSWTCTSTTILPIPLAAHAKEYERDEAAIMLQLKKDYALLIGEGYCVLGCFLFGSQNYDLDYNGSDIDVKAIIIPEFSKAYKPNSEVIMFRPGTTEQISIVTFENYLSKLQNCCPDWTEILFTKYYYCNPKLRQYWEKIQSLKDRIVCFDNYLYLDALRNLLNNQAISVEKNLIHSTDTRKENKRLGQEYRIKRLLENYAEKEQVSLSLTDEDKQTILNYKLFTTYDHEERVVILKKFVRQADEIIYKYKSTHPRAIDASVFDELLKLYQKIKEDIANV